MIAFAARTFFHLLARSGTVKTLASRYGTERPTSFARRFIAGETIEEAIGAVRRIESRGLRHTLDFLGESVASLADADAATHNYRQVIDAVIAAGIERNISLKLTQLGLDVDRACTIDNLRKILDKADGFFVRIDMEQSQYTEVTLEIFETLWGHGYKHIGVVLQADLHRTEADLRRVLGLGARVRLVKGAYQEPRSIAYHRKEDVDAAFVRCLKVLLTEGHYPAIATHDASLIEVTKRLVSEHQLPLDSFEFQMLYGVRRDLQAALARSGFRVRVYVPFGHEWFPYFMRRLGERPENVMFVVRSLLREGVG